MTSRTVDPAGHLARLPAHPLAAMLLLRLVRDDETSLEALGRLVGVDPVLSARVMRLANTSRPGPPGGIASAAHAVVQLGSATVTGVAAAAASTLLAEDVELAPPEHWVHALAVAAGASAAAGIFGVVSGEAFSAGLLHDIGSLLLEREDADLHRAVVARAARARTARVLELAERRAFGTTHADAGADALGLWSFPDTFVDAVRHHHGPLVGARPLTQAVILGEAVAVRVEPVELGEGRPRLVEHLVELGLDPALEATLVADARRQVAEITRLMEEGA